MRLAISLAAAATALFANGANPDAIKPIKDFTPPPPYTPNVAQSAFAENQFDRRRGGRCLLAFTRIFNKKLSII